MSRTHRFLSGVGFGYAGQALVMVAALWLTPFFLDRVGQHDYGLWLVCAQIISYVLLLDLGVVALLPRETAYATGGSDPGALARVVARTRRLVLWQTPLVAVSALVVWSLIPGEWSVLRGPLGAILATFVLVFPLRIFQALLNGLQELGYLGAVHIVVWAAGTALSVLLVASGAGMWGLAGGWITIQLAAPIAWWWRVRTRWQHLLPRPLPTPARADIRQHLGKGIWVSVAQVAQVLLQGTELVVIARVLGPAAVVPFACTSKLAAVLANQPQILMQAASPALSELKVAAPRSHLFGVSSALTRAMLLGSGAVACVVLAVNQGFVGWWVGPDQYGGGWLTLALLIAMLLRHWNTTAVYTVFCFGHERAISVLTLADAVVTVGASIVLIRWLGPIGAPLGSLAGVCLVSLPRNLTLIARDTDTALSRLVAFHWPWTWRFTLLLAAAAALSLGWQPTTPAAMAAATVGVAIAYGLTMLPLLLRPPLGTYVVPRLASFRAWLGMSPLVPAPTKHGDG